ncbi:MAG: hypothetical protein GC201_10930 [Alphaproteobacteria bacterium]|nr:hypothetical protein [Alphaproteobacteria bacterium]
MTDSARPLRSATGEGNSEPATRRRRRRLRVAPSEEFEAKSRVFMYEFCELLCKVLPGYGQMFRGDLAKVFILLALAAANVQRLMASQQRGAFEAMKERVPGELQTPVNALSVAEATGLPRETVRRKLKEMITSGAVVEDERGGYRLRPGTFQQEQMTELYFASFRAFAKAADVCLEAGLLEVQEG